MPLIKCSSCGKKIYRKPSHIPESGNNYCSSNCQHKARRLGKLVKCHICSKETYKQRQYLQKSKSGYFFCSKKCSIKWQNTYFTGTKHPNWTTGQFSYRSILLSKQIPIKCFLCGLEDKEIMVVHHIDKNRKNNKPENLKWLCPNCHYLVHHYKDVSGRLNKLITRK